MNEQTGVRDFNRDAVEQLGRYAQDHPMQLKANAHGWTLHRIVCVVRGWTRPQNP